MGTCEQPSIPRAGLAALVRPAVVAAVLTSLIGWCGASWLPHALSSPARASAAARSILQTALTITIFAALTAFLSWWAARRRDAGTTDPLAPPLHAPTAVDASDPTAEGADHAAGIARGAREDAASLVDHHRQLDEAITQQLRDIVSDSEAGALTMIKQLCALSEGATTLLGFLGNSDRSAHALDSQIEGSVASIVEIAAFVQSLPSMIREDVEAIHAAAVQELNGLQGFTAIIKSISDQTNLLAVNTAILAATSGSATAGFGVVAREMRALSDRSAEAATMIEEGLGHAQRTMREGLKMSSMERRIQEGAATVESIRQLQNSYDDVRGYYRLTFKVVTEHNTTMAQDISDILGHFQGQDVMRQRLDRITAALARRNDVLQTLPAQVTEGRVDLSSFPRSMLDVLHEFLSNEARHTLVSSVATQPTDAPKFELF